MGGWHATAERKVKKLSSCLARHTAQSEVEAISHVPLGKARHSHPDGKRGNAETLHLAAPGRTRLYLADLTVPGCT